MSSSAFTIRHAHLTFGKKILFDQLHLSIEQQQWTALLGPSGVGKSTLLRFIAGLIDNKSADIGMAGSVDSSNNMPITQQIAYMAQDALLLPWLTVLENVLISLRLKKISRLDKNNLTERAVELLAAVKLSATKDLYPQQLSGGMKQRVALARTLLQDKPIILMDEPFSALDAISRYQLQNLSVNLLKDRTVLFITHDPQEALRLAHSIYILAGAPARLTLFKKLTTDIPRQLTSTPLAELSNDLLTMLAQAYEEIA